MTVKRTTVLCWLGLLLISALTVCGGSAMSNEKEFLVRIPDFRDSPSENLSQVVDQAVKSHREIIENLIGQLRESNLSNEGKVFTIYLLGQLRAAEAVTILIENIELQAAKVDPKGRKGRWGMYPAQEALAKIGHPAVNMILDKLPTERDELRRKLMCYVISDVEGKELGVILLKLRQDEESDPMKKSFLGLALKILEDM